MNCEHFKKDKTDGKMVNDFPQLKKLRPNFYTEK